MQQGTRMARLAYAALVISMFFVTEAGARTKDDYDPYNGIMTQFKNPTPWLELGADFRFRVVYDEARKLDQNATGHDRVNTRYRGRFKAKVKHSEDLDFNIQLITEPRYYHRPPSMDKQFIRHEVLFNQLNFVLRNAFGLPMTATVGRQEFKLGSGWLIRDGTPLDGGRTNFFNAIRLTWDLSNWDTTADFVWVENHGDSAKWIKPFNDRDIDLAEQDERGLIVYLSKKRSEDSTVDVYFVYKQDHRRRRSSGYQGEIYTLGAMFFGKINEHWAYCFEVAPQFGHKDGKELNAFGSNNMLTYTFNDAKKNKIDFGYEYLSGNDDPDKYFDKVWGRIDTWSVLYQGGGIDSLDGRASDNSNLHRIHMTWTTEPVKDIEAKASYNLLFADDNPMTGGTGGLGKSGCLRGQLFRAQIKHQISKNLSHRIEGELFLPGDFYSDARNDVAVFARYGIS